LKEDEGFRLAIAGLLGLETSYSCLRSLEKTSYSLFRVTRSRKGGGKRLIRDLIDMRRK